MRSKTDVMLLYSSLYLCNYQASMGSKSRCDVAVF